MPRFAASRDSYKTTYDALYRNPPATSRSLSRWSGRSDSPWGGVPAGPGAASQLTGKKRLGNRGGCLFGPVRGSGLMFKRPWELTNHPWTRSPDLRATYGEKSRIKARGFRNSTDVPGILAIPASPWSKSRGAYQRGELTKTRKGTTHRVADRQGTSVWWIGQAGSVITAICLRRRHCTGSSVPGSSALSRWVCVTEGGFRCTSIQPKISSRDSWATLCPRPWT
jgi:hypothetical protein